MTLVHVRRSTAVALAGRLCARAVHGPPGLPLQTSARGQKRTLARVPAGSKQGSSHEARLKTRSRAPPGRFDARYRVVSELGSRINPVLRKSLF